METEKLVGSRHVIKMNTIDPDALYPLREACPQLTHIAYRTACRLISEGTFPLPYKKIHARLILVRGSDILKYLEGGDWVMPKKPRYRHVG